MTNLPRRKAGLQNKGLSGAAYILNMRGGSNPSFFAILLGGVIKPIFTHHGK